MPRGFFITGTDTDVGKTQITLALMHALKGSGKRVTGMKPVASGCDTTAEGLRNKDALQLQAMSSVSLPYNMVNPYSFEPAIAPHIAANLVNENIDLNIIADLARSLMAETDILCVEGVGGWQVPLNMNATTEDLVRVLQLPIILVVGLRVGCLNHALLTQQAMSQAGLDCVGWIANQIDRSFTHRDENIATLKDRLNLPLLGVVPFLATPSPEAISVLLDTNPLFA